MLLVAAAFVVFAACGAPVGENTSTVPSASTATTAATTTTTTTIPAGPGEADHAQVLALALRQLVTVDSSFGPGHAFTELLVQSALDPAAGLAFSAGGPQRALTEAERTAIEAALSDLAPVRWIGDPADWRTENLAPTVQGAAILGVGEPRFDGRGALVPVSLWCGGVCGTWLTYRLALRDGAWSVTGIEGPAAIS